MAPAKEPSGFRVIIAGGGIAGLCLANALQRANIDYVLLEGRDEIAPQVGASIGIGPSGARILDQLGCYDDINEQSAPVDVTGHHYEDGSLITPKQDTYSLVAKRSNYDICFLDRQYVLEAMYKTIDDKSKILTGKRILKVDHSAQGVEVHCRDGSSYQGDVVTGADGVNSMVRQEMWRAADSAEPGKIPEKEKKALFFEYQVLFGISSATDGINFSDYDVTYTKGLSTMVIGGKHKKVYWFIFKQMDRVYNTGEIPRYTSADAEAFAEKVLDLPITEQGRIKFGDIWKNRTSYTLVPTEEAEYEHWTWGRFACLGDSIHKVTPNMGAGGNMSIESAAALANVLKKLVDDHPSTRPPLEAVCSALLSFQKIRQLPSSKTMVLANGLTRIQALKTPMDKFTAFYIVPNAGDYLADITAELTVGCNKLDYLPTPARSLDAPMPFNPEQGLGRAESKLKRMLFALPFLGLTALAFRSIHLDLVPQLESFHTSILHAGKFEWNTSSVAIRDTFYHMKWLDDILRPLTVVFLPSQLSEPITSWQMPTFLTDFGVLYSIWLIESVRRNNLLTPFQLPSMFALAAQVFALGVIGHMYYFLHYIASPISNFKASDMRLTNLLYTRSVLPAMALCYYLPVYMSYNASSPSLLHAWNWIFQLFPVWVALCQYLLAKTVMPDTMQHDRIHKPMNDLQTIYFTIGTLVTVSATVWLFTIFNTPFSLSTLLIPYPDSPSTFASLARQLLQYDELYAFAGASLWLVYLFSDLKKAEMVTRSWFTMLAAFVVLTLVLGPGAACGLAWLWREHVLATKRHKGAIIRKPGMEMNGVAEKGVNSTLAKGMNGKAMNGTNGTAKGKGMNGMNGHAKTAVNGSAMH